MHINTHSSYVWAASLIGHHGISAFSHQQLQTGADLCPGRQKRRQLLLLLQEADCQGSVVVQRSCHDIDQQVLCAPLLHLRKLLPYPLRQTHQVSNKQPEDSV